MNRPSTWWTRGYVQCLTEAVAYFKKKKEAAWNDFENADDIRQYRLGFYQGALSSYRDLQASLERCEEKAEKTGSII